MKMSEIIRINFFIYLKSFSTLRILSSLIFSKLSLDSEFSISLTESSKISFTSSSLKSSSSKIVSSGPDGLDGVDGAEGAEGAGGGEGLEGADGGEYDEGAGGQEGDEEAHALSTPGIKFEKSPNLMNKIDLIKFLLIIKVKLA